MSYDDETVLLLPGMTMNTTIFPDLDRRHIGVDFTTLVASPTGDLPRTADSGMDFYADLLERQLEQDEKWQARTRLVVAHSFGGMLALSWLLRHRCSGPARIDGIVLVATTGGPMFDAATLGLAKIGPFEARLPLKGPVRLWNRPLVTRAVKRLLSKGGLEASRVDFSKLRRKTDLALDLAGWRNTDWRAMRTYRIAMSEFDVRERLSEISVPAIVLHGSKDAIFRPEIGARLAEALPSAEFRLVDGAAHGLPLTHPAHVVRAVADLASAH